jgi:ABC-type branched-subunit amino acid transport system substrate-binding protein
VGALLDLRRINNQQVELLPLKALELGVQEINNSVELDGIQPLVIDVCNVGVSPIDADNATRILIEERNVVAIIGPNTAAAATNMLARIKAAGVPAISPAIIDSAIANSASQGLFFRMAPVELEQGLQLVAQLTTLAGGMSTAQLGLLSVQNSYGNNIRSKFTAEWQRKDPNNNKTDNFYQYVEGHTDLLDITTKALLDAKPSFTVLIPGSDSVAAISSLSGLPLDPKALNSYVSTTQLLVTSSGRTAELLALAKTGSPALKNHLTRITGVAPLSFAAAQEGNDFQVSFMADNPDLSLSQDLMVGYTYDALFVIGAASAVVKGAQMPSQILSFLRRLTGTNNSLSLRSTAFKQTVQTLTQNTSDPFTLLGATGAIRFLANGGRDPVLLESWTIETSTGKYINTPLTM